MPACAVTSVKVTGGGAASAAARRRRPAPAQVADPKYATADVRRRIAEPLPAARGSVPSRDREGASGPPAPIRAATRSVPSRDREGASALPAPIRAATRSVLSRDREGAVVAKYETIFRKPCTRQR